MQAGFLAETALNTGRYASQAAIPAWDQNRLTGARVVILGSQSLATCIALGLAGLGIGEITILDNRRMSQESGVLALQGKPGHLAVRALAGILQQVNPEIKTRGIPFGLLYDAHAAGLPACNVLIDATNDPVSKQICMEWGEQHGIPVILAWAGSTSGAYQVIGVGDSGQDPVLVMPAPQDQGMIPSMVIGGLVLEEIRKLLLPLRAEDQATPRTIGYDLKNPNRFDASSYPEAVLWHLPEGAHCLIVGAGALGTMVGLCLASSGTLRLSIVDPDSVEDSNLNRQVLFYDAIGRPKAPELAAKLHRLYPKADTRGIVAAVGDEHLRGVDVIFLCVDNFQARDLVNDLACRFSIPVINGGTGPFSGEVEVYQPGKSACLECRTGVGALAESEAGEPASCARAPEPSVVISNQIIGGLMAGESSTVLVPAEYGEPITTMIQYDAFHSSRLGLVSPRSACRCHLRGQDG